MKLLAIIFEHPSFSFDLNLGEAGEETDKNKSSRLLSESKFKQSVID